MSRLVRVVASHPKTALISLSILVAALGLWFFSTRTPDVSDSSERSEETTLAFDTTSPDFGAAVYFPQGTNPPLLDTLTGESVAIEDVRRRPDEIVVVGISSGGEIRCELLIGGVGAAENSEPELRIVDDAFLQTFELPPKERTSDRPYSVACGPVGVPRDEWMSESVPSE